MLVTWDEVTKDEVQKANSIPLGKNPLTLTTTLTLPPPAAADAPFSFSIGTTTLSRDLNEGLEADDGAATGLPNAVFPEPLFEADGDAKPGC